MLEYTEVFSRLTYETAVIVFLKKDGTIRPMLGTRNLHTVEIDHGFQGIALGGHDKRCNISNGNIAVFDLLLGDARSFNIERLLDIKWCGEIRDKEGLKKACQDFIKFREEYEHYIHKAITMDDLD